MEWGDSPSRHLAISIGNPRDDFHDPIHAWRKMMVFKVVVTRSINVRPNIRIENVATLDDCIQEGAGGATLKSSCSKIELDARTKSGVDWLPVIKLACCVLVERRELLQVAGAFRRRFPLLATTMNTASITGPYLPSIFTGDHRHSWH